MGKKSYTTTAYTNVDDFIYGKAVTPVTTKRGLVIGGGKVYPEVNFTLPTMLVTKETMPEVLDIYREIADGICARAVDLELEGVQLECEWVPQTTFEPEWGIQHMQVIEEVVEGYYQKYGLKGSIRSTPVDVREVGAAEGLEHMWHGSLWDKVVRSMEGSAAAGNDFLSIESIGGKDVHDEGLMYNDISKIIFALGVLGAKDMEKLWGMIVDVAAKHPGCRAAGDTACGFANTAMVLAEQNYISRVFGATARVAATVRTMVANQMGATGPDKDCGYEGVIVKAITGTPVTMEGHVACVAHLSRVGNVAICCADLWSNESIQHIKLLGGWGEVVGLEQLTYDCRLLNGARDKGWDHELQSLYADSDSYLDPHAYILRPDVALEIAKGIVSAPDNAFLRVKKAVEMALKVMRQGYNDKRLRLNDRELSALGQLEDDLGAITDDEGAFTEEQIASNSDNPKFKPALYDL
ncbi:MAG: methanol--corrinoid methyltransferase [Coriobacteriia bacterium]|nr:methanol--corrinoid methyltransferase [Coriobacteriia bacterium]